MKKIYESPIHSTDNAGETAEIVHVFELENEDEFWELEDATEDEREEFMGVKSDCGYNVMPGALAKTFDIEVTPHHVVMIEHLTLNV